MKEGKWILPLVFAILLTASLILACGDDDDADGDDDDTDGDKDDSAMGCTIEQLCQAGVECEGWDTVQECLDAIDAALGLCADADGYLACSCNCMNSYTDCDDQMECGLNCPQTFCF